MRDFMLSALFAALCIVIVGKRVASHHRNFEGGQDFSSSMSEGQGDDNKTPGGKPLLRNTVQGVGKHGPTVSNKLQGGKESIDNRQVKQEATKGWTAFACSF